jgi:hypothetical protein
MRAPSDDRPAAPASGGPAVPGIGGSTLFNVLRPPVGLGGRLGVDALNRRAASATLLAVDVGTRAVVDGYLRPGSCASSHGLEDFIRKLIADSRHPAEQTIFRMDKG